MPTIIKSLSEGITNFIIDNVIIANNHSCKEKKKKVNIPKIIVFVFILLFKV